MNAPARPSASPADALPRSDDAGVTTLTLNRPAARNSLSQAMLTALEAALDAIAADPSVRVVILAANGPAFCAGHDLKELAESYSHADGGRAHIAQTMTHCSRVMQKIVQLPQPVIACVQGTATAAGCQIVASCDLAVTSTASGFCTPGVNIGLFCSSPMVPLSRNIAPKHALEMLFTGETITADEAFRIGLVNKVVAPERLRDETLTLARKIAAKSKMTISLGKRAFYQQTGMNLADAYGYAAQVMVENMMKHDAKEGIAAFLEKRKPQWQDR